MNKEIILDEIEKDISIFDNVQLKEVFDFVKFLKNKNEIDPTIEILENEPFYQSVKIGIQEKKEGKLNNWNDIK